MNVTVNGEPSALAEGTTVAALVAQLGLRERRVAVEVNQQVVPRDAYADTALRAGDIIEIVHFVGGG
jgi:sulfur carrier protein